LEFFKSIIENGTFDLQEKKCSVFYTLENLYFYGGGNALEGY